MQSMGHAEAVACRVMLAQLLRTGCLALTECSTCVSMVFCAAHSSSGLREVQVMDMASGKVYFWNDSNDEVAWEPPIGSQPRSKQETDHNFAAHLSATRTAAAADQLSTEPAPATVSLANGEKDATAAPAAKAEDVLAVTTNGIGEEAATSSDSSAEAMEEGLPAGTQQNKAEQEEGQLSDDATAAAAGPAAEQPASASVSAPSSAVAALGQQVLGQSQQALQSLCPGVPQLVRLAIEAEIRLQDWHMFAAKQHSAAARALPEEALSWEDFQDHVQWRWRSIEAAMPEAVAQAHKLRVMSGLWQASLAAEHALTILVKSSTAVPQVRSATELWALRKWSPTAAYCVPPCVLLVMSWWVD